MDNQDLSALLDGEQLLTNEEIAAQDTTTLGRYALIGDVMRAESEDAFVLDISDSVAKALESEPVYADFSQKQDTQVAAT
ncbi:RseA family anti-sigma factor, partial [Streptomyces galilaeus]|uniref:RseA family anti-sigma factor n=1 Tax=Streptomyces galilaeus TaxID=33899 RepID=UPI0038F71E11